MDGSDYKSAAFSLLHAFEQREECFGRLNSMIRRADPYSVFTRTETFPQLQIGWNGLIAFRDDDLDFLCASGF